MRLVMVLRLFILLRLGLVSSIIKMEMAPGYINLPLCFTVLLILVVIIVIMLFLAHDRAKIQKVKRGTA